MKKLLGKSKGPIGGGNEAHKLIMTSFKQPCQNTTIKPTGGWTRREKQGGEEKTEIRSQGGATSFRYFLTTILQLLGSGIRKSHRGERGNGLINTGGKIVCHFRKKRSQVKCDGIEHESGKKQMRGENRNYAKEGNV